MKNENITNSMMFLIALAFSAAIKSVGARIAEWESKDEEFADFHIGNHNDWWLKRANRHAEVDREYDLYLVCRHEGWFTRPGNYKVAYDILDLAKEIFAQAQIMIRLPFDWNQIDAQFRIERSREETAKENAIRNFRDEFLDIASQK